MKKSLKKGGVAEIVSLMIIVGIVIALIIAVVLPMANQSRNQGVENASQFKAANDITGSLRSSKVSSSI